MYKQKKIPFIIIVINSEKKLIILGKLLIKVPIIGDLGAYSIIGDLKGYLQFWAI